MSKRLLLLFLVGCANPVEPKPHEWEYKRPEGSFTYFWCNVHKHQPITETEWVEALSICYGGACTESRFK